METERFEARLGADEVGELRAVIDAVSGTVGAGVPLSSPLLLFSRLDADRRAALFAVPEGRVLVQEHLLVETRRRIVVGEPITVVSRTVAPVGDGAPCRIEVDLLDTAGAQIAEVRTALRAVPSTSLAASHGLPLGRAGGAGGVVRHATGVIDAALVRRWVRLVGDDNPVHVDPVHAAALGLAGPVVPGALMAAAAEAFLGASGEEGHLKLNMRFTGPMPIGRPGSVEVRTRAQAAERRELRLFFAADDRIAMVADVAVGRG